MDPGGHARNGGHRAICGTVAAAILPAAGREIIYRAERSEGVFVA